MDLFTDKNTQFLSNDGRAYPYGLLYGEQQSGKSDAQIAIARFKIERGVVPVQVLCKSEDVKQYIKSLKEYDAKMGTATRWVLASDLRDKKSKLINTEKIISAFVARDIPPPIILLLCHGIQLGRFYRLTRIIEGEKTGKREFCMIMDEAHKTMFPERKEVMTSEMITDFIINSSEHTDVRKMDAVPLLMSISEQTIGVTATPSRNLNTTEYPINFLMILQPTDSYVSFKDLKYRHIDELPSDFDKETGNDEDLKDFLREFSALPPLSKADYPDLKREKKPLLALVQVSAYSKRHEIVWNMAVKDKDVRDACAVVVYNSISCRIRFPDSCVEYFKENILESLGKVKFEKNVLHVNTTKTVCYILDICQALPMLDRIVFVAGNRLREGIRVNSSDYEIAITHEFLRHSSTLDVGMQKIRAVGYRYDKTPVEVWCTQNLHLDLIKAFILNHEVLKYLLKKVEDDKSSLNALSGKKVFTQKIPELPLCKGDLLLVATYTKTSDDFGDTIDMYKEAIKKGMKGKRIDNIDDFFEETATTKTKGFKADKDETLNEITGKEYTRLTKKMFPVWGKTKGLKPGIAKFMWSVKPEKTYSKKALKKLLRDSGIKSDNIGQILSVKTGTNGYGTIFTETWTEDNKLVYVMYPKLTKSYNKHFK